MLTATLKVDALRNNPYCVVEYYSIDTTGATPPTLIMVNDTRLSDIGIMADALSNSEFARLTAINPNVMINVVSTHETRFESRRIANMYMRKFPTLPVCNFVGIDTFGMSRDIECSNGQIYKTQQEAALATGISQGHISRVLSGELRTAKGLNFRYKPLEARPVKMSMNGMG